MSRKKKLIRLNFKESVFARDGHKCKFCDTTENLDAHHITDRTLMPNDGYVKENGITLCKWHHMQAEHFHDTNGSEWTEGMHPTDLYNLIDSSYDKATEAANKG